MDWQQIVGLGITWLIMLIGVFGCVLPGVPGAPLVFVAALVHRLIFGEGASASTWMLGVIFILMLFSVLFDYLASMYGAKKLGSSGYGIVGAVLGGMIGLMIFNIPGALLGPFVGAFACEIISGKDWKGSGKAGVGAMAMAGLFTIDVVLKIMTAATH